MYPSLELGIGLEGLVWKGDAIPAAVPCRHPPHPSSPPPVEGTPSPVAIIPPNAPLAVEPLRLLLQLPRLLQQLPRCSLTTHSRTCPVALPTCSRIIPLSRSSTLRILCQTHTNSSCAHRHDHFWSYSSNLVCSAFGRSCMSDESFAVSSASDSARSSPSTRLRSI